MSEVVKVVADAASSSEFTFKDYMYAAGACISVVSAVVALVSARWTFKRDLNSLGDSEVKIFELISKAESELVKFNVRLKEKIESEGNEFIFKESYRVELDCLSENFYFFFWPPHTNTPLKKNNKKGEKKPMEQE
ncbi:hypothetical protein NO375_24265 [Escherichia coli]|nr:hypothetical protein [Escherichia coli]